MTPVLAVGLTLLAVVWAAILWWPERAVTVVHADPAVAAMTSADLLAALDVLRDGIHTDMAAYRVIADELCRRAGAEAVVRGAESYLREQL